MSNDTDSSDGAPIKSAYEKAVERMAEREQAQQDQPSEAEDSSEAPAQTETAVNIDYKDKYLRSCAELENYRLRVKREKTIWTTDAIRSWAQDFVVILDNLNLAITTTENNDQANDESFLNGIRAIRDQFTNQLRQRGVTAIEAKSGDPFDPDRHEALMLQESPDVEGQVLGAILRTGYMIKDQVLRPTQVQVLRGASKPAASQDA